MEKRVVRMKKEILTVRLDKGLKEEFQQIAETHSQVPSKLIRSWIEKYVGEHKDETVDINLK